MKLTIFSLISIFIFLASCGPHILSKEEQKELNERKAKCEDAVSYYIKKYAQFPESYESIEFSGYTEMCEQHGDEKIPNSENYIIFHKHKLKDKNGNIQVFAGYFYLTNVYEVDIIEIKKSNSISTWPPETKVWTDKFGRPLNAQDSLDILTGTEKVTKETLGNLKEDLKNADQDNLTDKDKKLLKNILDTVK